MAAEPTPTPARTPPTPATELRLPRGIILTDEGADVFESKRGAWIGVGMVLAASLAGWWVLANHPNDLFYQVLFVVVLGTMFKVVLWDSLLGLVRSVPRLRIDRNGISYAGAFARDTAVWEEITSLEYSDYGLGLILVGVDMAVWKRSRSWWRRAAGSFVASSMSSQVGVATPFYIQCYRIAASPEVFAQLARRFAPPHVRFNMPEIIRTSRRPPAG